jgi:hypothetical protein
MPWQAGADLHTAVHTGDYFQPAPSEDGDSGGTKSKKGSKKKSKKKK